MGERRAERRSRSGAFALALLTSLSFLLAFGQGPGPEAAAAQDPLAAADRSHRPKPTRTPKPTQTIAPTPTPTATPTPTPTATPTPTPSTAVTWVGAGDIASCASSGDEATAALLDAIDGTVFTLGDNVYDSGSPTEFANCYDPTWGRHKGRTRPSAGNHDYGTPGAAGYFGYFGAAAGDPATGYYAYDLGSWRIYALNSNCAAVGGCGAGSPQEQWLRADLASDPRACVAAYWHHPRFSSGSVHGSSTATQALWQALYDAGAELALAGHEHNYERFGPQTPTGAADPSRGIVEFVVGTGGKDRYGFGTPIANSAVRSSSTWGVLRLDLQDGGWSFAFVAAAGSTFTDSGSGVCH